MNTRENDLNNIKLFFIVIILISVIVIDKTWQYYLEMSTRTQAQYNLKQAQVCVNDILLTKNKMYPVYNKDITDTDVEKALKTCAREMKVSATGDMFAYNLRTKAFIFDPSIDCYVEDGKCMTEESECSLHFDKQLCKQVLRTMDSGYNSDRDTQTYWKFNKSKEYLEWIILPSTDIGYDGVQRGSILKPFQVVLTQGVIEDEIRARYLPFRIVVHSIGFFAIFLVLIIAKNCKNEN